MNKITIPNAYNYIAAFLTLSCNLKCSYCINRFESKVLASRKLMSGKEWVEAINRIETRPDLPVTLQGGEPSLHPDFYYILQNIREDIPVDLLTNLQFDVYEFMQNVCPDRFKREAKYASIRVSFHPEQHDIDKLRCKVLILQKNGYSVGVWMVDDPFDFSKYFIDAGIDFRIKEFLGERNGKLEGTYKYPGAVTKQKRKNVVCKTSELIIGPNGNVYRCHADLYENRQSVGNIKTFFTMDEWITCSWYGHCNPCDIKVKTNRFQEFGHTSVEIKEV